MSRLAPAGGGQGGVARPRGAAGARRGAALLLLFLFPGVARAHGTSKSYGDWTVRGQEVEARTSFTTHDFALAYRALDADDDQRLSEAEFERGAADIRGRLTAAVELRAGPPGGLLPCTLDDSALRTVGAPPEEIQLSLRYRCPAPIAALELALRYLPELEPPHIAVATVGHGALTAQHVFTRDAERFLLELEPPSLGEELGSALLAGLGLLASVPAALLLLLGSLGRGRLRRLLLLGGPLLLGLSLGGYLAPGPVMARALMAAPALVVGGWILIAGPAAPAERWVLPPAALALGLAARGASAWPGGALGTPAALLGSALAVLVAFSVGQGLWGLLPQRRLGLLARTLGVAACAAAVVMVGLTLTAGR